MACLPDGPWFKVILLGEVGVGKTAIFQRIKNDIFRPIERATICIDSCTRVVKINGSDISLTLWDTAGVERFRTLTRNYYRNAHGVILVYNANDSSSLHALSRWLKDADDFCPSALRFLIGNKMDLEQVVKKNSAKDFAEMAECECLFLTSAKNGTGIESALKTIADKLLSHHAKQELRDSMDLFNDNIDINRNKKSETFSSCPC